MKESVVLGKELLQQDMIKSCGGTQSQSLEVSKEEYKLIVL